MKLAGPDAGDVIQVAIFVIIILGSIFGSFVERMARKKRQEEALQRLRESRERREAEGPPPRPGPQRTSFFDEEEEEDEYDEPPARVDPAHTWFQQRTAPRHEPPGQPEIVVREVIEEQGEHEGDLGDLGDAGEEVEASTLAAFAEEGSAHAARSVPFHRRVFKGAERHPVAEAVVYAEVLGPCRGVRIIRGDRRVRSY